MTEWGLEKSPEGLGRCDFCGEEHMGRGVICDLLQPYLFGICKSCSNTIARLWRELEEEEKDSI